jgi:transcription initiation factor TFIIIB Brf1 subunit/transcription initiation factor TFIIB
MEGAVACAIVRADRELEVSRADRELADISRTDRELDEISQTFSNTVPRKIPDKRKASISQSSYSNQRR